MKKLATIKFNTRKNKKHHKGSKFNDDLLAESFAKVVVGKIESYVDKVETLTHKNVPNISSTYGAIMFYFLHADSTFKLWQHYSTFYVQSNQTNKFK